MAERPRRHGGVRNRNGGALDAVLVARGPRQADARAERGHGARARRRRDAAGHGGLFGSLGFLTEVTLPELYRSLETALTGRAVVEERLMLRSTTTRQGTTFAEAISLNDTVITKTARSRLIDLSVYVGDEFVTRVKADGLIVATPTGSTAYNLAAGGPIVQPSVDALVLTPIAPHTLTNRPIVIPGSSAVRVVPNMEPRDEVFVTFDGQQGFRLVAGDEVAVRRAGRPMRLIKPSTRSYFEILRTKLKWGEMVSAGRPGDAAP
ncbi:MAG: NAD(+) kinase [Acidobacteria bacterium]|nr:MAG: NAD(+) kinase [Acidobacteriota bacterium]